MKSYFSASCKYLFQQGKYLRNNANANYLKITSVFALLAHSNTADRPNRNTTLQKSGRRTRRSSLREAEDTSSSTPRASQDSSHRESLSLPAKHRGSTRQTRTGASPRRSGPSELPQVPPGVRRGPL